VAVVVRWPVLVVTVPEVSLAAAAAVGVGSGCGSGSLCGYSLYHCLMVLNYSRHKRIY